MSEATHKNILAIKQHSDDTRKLFRELEEKMIIIETLNNRVDMLETSISALQIKLYSGGSSA